MNESDRRLSLEAKFTFLMFLRMIFHFVEILISSSKQTPPVAFPKFSKQSPMKSMQAVSVQLIENKVLVKVQGSQISFDLSSLLLSFTHPSLY